MKKTALIGSALFLTPFVALAQNLNLSPVTSPNLGYFTGIVVQLAQIINLLIPLLIAVALLVFFYGLITYIRKPEHKEGRKVMVAGLVALFVMVSVWGIIKLAQTVLGVQGNNANTQQLAPRVQ